MPLHQRLSPPDALDQWLVRAVLILLFSASAILLVGQYTDVDLYLADLYFDAQRQVFPWDHTWFGRDLMHGMVKNVIVWIGFLIIGAALFDLVRPFPRLSSLQRVQMRVVALAAVLEPILIRTLKSSSNLHCPWGVERFGGSHPFLRLLDAVPDGWVAGHCFPAGHASTAMWLSALAVLWLPHSPRRAWLAFLGGLGVGLTLGWVQQMRGQHFLTHTLGTAWLSSALVIALIAAFLRPLVANARSAHYRSRSRTALDSGPSGADPSRPWTQPGTTAR